MLSTPTPHRRAIRVAAVTTCAALTVAFAASPAAPAAELPDLVVTAAFDKNSYVLNEPATATFTLRNNGSATAENVRIGGSESAGFTSNTTPTLGFSLAPGEVSDVVFTGTINQFGHDTGAAFLAVQFDSGDGGENSDANPEDNIAVAKAKVIGATAPLRGKVYHEADGDPDTVDPEGVPGAEIALFDDFAPDVVAVEATSDSAGKFLVTDVPVGSYRLRVTLPAGWQLADNAPQGVLIFVGSEEDLNIPAVRVVGPTSPPTPGTPTPPAGHHGPQLPATGASVTTIVGLGLAILATGLVFLVAARQRRPVADQTDA